MQAITVFAKFKHKMIFVENDSMGTVLQHSSKQKYIVSNYNVYQANFYFVCSINGHVQCVYFTFGAFLCMDKYLIL